MIAIGLLFVRMLCDCFKSRSQLEAEILVLRHQLNVLRSSRRVDSICVGPTVLCSFGTRSFLSDRRCRSLSASAIRPIQHSAPLRLSMIARPHEVSLVDSWRADSQKPEYGSIPELPHV